MKITIIGWYGTETLGDRAILAGIIALLNDCFSSFEIALGSLYPFFTERTLAEDEELYAAFCGKKINIQLFDSRKIKELEQAIRQSDMLIMGGGPLMHIHTMFMVEYAFKYARKQHKKTMIMGCGIGPLEKRMHQRSLLKIFANSDVVVLRDKASAEFYRQLDKKARPVLEAIDPAVRCLMDYKSKNYYFEKTTPFVAINFRAFPSEYNTAFDKQTLTDSLLAFVGQICRQFPEHVVRLVPMHYFHIGNDDRMFLHQLRFDLAAAFPQVVVQNEPLSLFETMQLFAHADANVGMRFHAVVFQTILQGNNYILDYTDPTKGKIIGFLRDIEAERFYRNRYVNLQNQPQSWSFDPNIENFTVNTALLEEKLAVYPQAIDEMLL
ncbi:MAG: polysaccharide pyruvyl transferase family protein [Chitinophagales bacterium]|nr:polysaccharide pyruvyl transferase family protein [Bacteroidota bacterium]MCB9044295.1 polysaccharide pyruvyl transferase family protein [Chitinophagales bacterium]